jgi:hypothetical protein
MVYAPPGSGYVRFYSDGDIDPTNESSELYDQPTSSHAELTSRDVSQISPRELPHTYEPMLEYPGTMRPGRTPENMPYHDLPYLDVNTPNPVPWPHFQEIEWHHRWDPPHEQALEMEEFIDLHGRWASVEDEAEMRMGMRRGVRERRELEEGGATPAPLSVSTTTGGGEQQGQMVIMDDDDYDDDDDTIDRNDVGGPMANIGNLGLGDGVKDLLQNARDAAAAAAAAASSTSSSSSLQDDDDDDDYVDSVLDDDDDDFLLDLGLEGGADDDGDDDDDILLLDDDETPAKMTKKGASLSTSKTTTVMTMDEEENDDDDEIIDELLDEDLDLGFELGFDDDEELEIDVDNDEDDEVDDDADLDDFDDDDVDDDPSLDDFMNKEDGIIDNEEEFDDGGFDFGDGASF